MLVQTGIEETLRLQALATARSKCRVRVTALACKVPQRFVHSVSSRSDNSEHARALPNPSLKLSPNGMSRRSPGAGPSAQYAPVAQRATPLVPA